MRNISITEALNELKLYGSKIEKAVSTAQFVGAAKKSSDQIGPIKKEVFEERAKAAYQSVTSLIANRNALKSAIVKSNAVTNIEVNGKKMTVAEAIERKKSIEYEEKLLIEMKKQYAVALHTVDKENKRVDAQIDELLETFVGKDTDKKLTRENQEAIEIPYREKNEFELVDPLKIFEKMQEMEAEIDGFRAEVDTRLVLSNATTFIELDF